MSNDKLACLTCHKTKVTYNCDGCSSRFCYEHLGEHRQELNGELEGFINDYNEYQQMIIEQNENKQNALLSEQIDRWETEAIEKIQQTAKECRQRLSQCTKAFVNEIKEEFCQLNEKIKQHKEDGFDEMDLNDLKTELQEITDEYLDSSNISLRHHSPTFIQRISVMSNLKLKHKKWKPNAITIVGKDGCGDALNQIFKPSAIAIDQNKTLYIADRGNRRIVRWKCDANEGQIIAGENEAEQESYQLSNSINMIIDETNSSLIIADRNNRRVIQHFHRDPSYLQNLINNIDGYSVSKDKYGCLYVADVKKHEVRRWRIGDQQGKLVAGGNGQGNRLNQLNCPTYIFVDDEQSVYVSDRGNNRVMKWEKYAEQGEIVAGGNGRGAGLNQLSAPGGLVVDQWGGIFVVDCDNHRIMRWYEDDEKGSIIAGGHGNGIEENQLDRPSTLSFDLDENLYVADYHNSRIQKFELMID
ncbi:unnamed protein product [Adineta ricciae]|uniref:Uncharacterized protein n=1 Tax=Adineta ricciae TaxID=249248 RepID=A0A814VL42_ADIRI|nr:unnamed protein product [Adineta ricciae]CAF1189875.1 unnamed protein product [Adineta ricciae]